MSAPHPAARDLPKSLERMENLFDRAGGWAIILSRILPYSIPEALVIAARLAAMPLRKFLIAVIIGCTPTAFVFAAIGDGWSDQPLLAMVVSYVLPIAHLPVAMTILHRIPWRQPGR